MAGTFSAEIGKGVVRGPVYVVKKRLSYVCGMSENVLSG